MCINSQGVLRVPYTVPPSGKVPGRFFGGRHGLGKPCRAWIELVMKNAEKPEFVFLLRLLQHTELEHTPKPLPTGYSGIPFIVGQGDGLGCALGVCCNFLGFLNHAGDSSYNR